jgi:hypothetical protein
MCDGNAEVTAPCIYAIALDDPVPALGHATTSMGVDPGNEE